MITMPRLTRSSITFFLVVSLVQAFGGQKLTAATSVDVVVYGATPGGVCAAIGAARSGASLVLLEPTAHVGGLNTGGLSHSDSNQCDRSTLMGLFDEWHTRIEKDYESRGVDLPYSIVVSSFPIDSHDCQRVALSGDDGPRVVNEGTIFPVRMKDPKQGFVYQVPYRSILPKPEECTNLLVPVALSCTHVGISSIRVEPTWMVLGQSAGIAAALAANREQQIAVQDLPYSELRKQLLAQGQVLDLPGTKTTGLSGQLPDPLPDQLPDPDDVPADQSKPVKVFVLMGQSNMLGFGRIGPAEKRGTLLDLTKNRNKYPHLVDDTGKWTERRDVRYVQVMHRNGKMSTLRNDWLTVKGNHIGPELQFGHIMGQLLDEPVLVLKSCIGNRSLGWDLLPPGSEQFEFEDKIYAGYKQSPLSWDKGTEPKPINWYAGKQYDDDVSDAKRVLSDIAKYYPEYKEQGFEVAGFVWWQGHKDQNAAHASRYEQNLVHLIKTLRKDFASPKAKFVMATIAFEGDELAGHGLTVANAQLAVSGETGKYPEFKGNVKTIDARRFWRDKSVSPSGAGYHYNHNAETYMEVGDALGRGMAELLRHPE